MRVPGWVICGTEVLLLRFVYSGKSVQEFENVSPVLCISSLAGSFHFIRVLSPPTPLCCYYACYKTLQNDNSSLAALCSSTQLQRRQCFIHMQVYVSKTPKASKWLLCRVHCGGEEGVVFIYLV